MAIRKTTILVTILHHDTDDVVGWDLTTIAGEMDEGCIVGCMEEVSSDEIPEDLVQSELLHIGNDGSFFDEDAESEG